MRTSFGVHGDIQFPAEFWGRGDMSRGELLLRSVAALKELEYFGLSPKLFRVADTHRNWPVDRPRDTGLVPRRN